MTDTYKASGGPSSPTPASSENPMKVDQVPPPEPFGLDTIPAGREVFFLVHGEYNVTLARGYNQPAVGIESWHREYSMLPAFEQVKRIWVVVNDTEDNLSFVTSIAADKLFRQRCRISTEGVPAVTKSKMLWEQKYSYPILSEEFRGSYDKQFEAIHQFQVFPPPSCVSKLKKLGRPKPKEDVPAPVPPWLLPYGRW